MKYLTLILIVVLYGISFNQVNEQIYEESDSIIANPERGLQKYSITDDNYVTTADYTNLTHATLTGWKTGPDKVTIIFRYFLLDKFINEDISSLYRNNIQNDFNQIRNSGLKCIVRFSYSNEQSTAPQQPEKSRIVQHINQLASVLQSNKDIILSHQAGFLGTWGEWYYTNSTEFGTDGNISTDQWANRKEIIEAMLQATPSAIPLQVRYPQIKKVMFGETLLDSTTAYENTAIARIGFFNDAFLNSWGDMGTYEVASESQNPIGTADYLYCANETHYTPMTGETNGLNPPRTDGDNAVIELDSTNWTTLNRDYFTQNFDNWIVSGHYADIVKGLGYRFVLQSSVFNLNGKKLTIHVKLINKGFARLVKKRDVSLILVDSASLNTYSTTINSDPRTWEKSVSIDQAIDLTRIPEGTYRSYLQLPDPDSALSLNTDYCIQFANKDMWNAITGYNNINQQVILKGAGIQDDFTHQGSFSINLYTFCTTVKVNYTLKDNCHTRLSIFNSKGMLMKVLVDGMQSNGIHTISFDWSELNNGLFYFMLETDWGKILRKAIHLQ